MIRVLVVDDQPLVRSGVRALLGAADDLVVIGEAVDGDDAVVRARASRPDVVVMDVRMPVVDGIEATRRIVADPDLAGTRVLVLTTFDLDEHVFAALRAGASGFLLKDAPPDQLRDAVRTVAVGDALLAPSATRQLVDEFVRSSPRGGLDPARLDALTDREREVVALVARGLTNAEIAAALVVSPATAKTHVSRAMGKLHVRDRAQLVVVAYETGLVRPGS